MLIKFTFAYEPTEINQLPFHVDLDLDGASMDGGGFISYQIEINPAYVTGSPDGICVAAYPPCHPGFQKISFGANISGDTTGTAKATKTISDANGIVLATLEPGGMFEIANPVDYQLLNIEVAWNTGDGIIDNATNNYKQSPGPLPILGAGAAFGFSRKLRGRIKASRAS